MNIDNKFNLVLGFSLNLTMLVEPTTSNIRHFTFKIQTKMFLPLNVVGVIHKNSYYMHRYKVTDQHAHS